MRAVALISETFHHHLDHLAPLSTLFECPLLVDDETTYALAKKLYPEVDVHLKRIDVLDLAKSYDLFLLSTKHAAKELTQILESNGIFHVRMCFCPHGFSDKGLSNPDLRIVAHQDIALLYSPLHQSSIEEGDAKETHVIGNYRLHYYQMHKERLDKLVEEEIFSQFGKQQPTYLYAPTWDDQEHSTSFFDHYKRLIDSIPDDCNLIVKLHPLLERQHPAHAHLALSFHLKKPNVQVLLESPLIYPLLNRIDHYIGDTSAIGYDFLYFNRPMHFLTKEDLPLHACGLKTDGASRLFQGQPISQDHLSKARQSHFNNSFSPFQENVIAALKSS